MKNLHILSTDKLTKISISKKTNIIVYNKDKHDTLAMFVNQNIYITNDEEIKEGDYYLYLKDNSVQQFIYKHHIKLLRLDIQKKIILTTDQDLIKDGVQAIDDEFLEWFVKNPSCEEIKIKLRCEKHTCHNKECNIICQELKYSILIQWEEPFKHEVKVLTKEEVMEGRSSAYEFIDFDKLEEAAIDYCDRFFGKDRTTHQWNDGYTTFINGAKWQQERSYSKDEVLEMLNYFGNEEYIKEWFEQFKKK